jgi:hypothetical protein
MRFEFLRISTSMLFPKKTPFYPFRLKIDFQNFGQGANTLPFSFVKNFNSVFNGESTERYGTWILSIRYLQVPTGPTCNFTKSTLGSVGQCQYSCKAFDMIGDGSHDSHGIP